MYTQGWRITINLLVSLDAGMRQHDGFLMITFITFPLG